MTIWGANVRLPSDLPRGRIADNTPTRATRKRRFLLFFTKTTIIESTWENTRFPDSSVDYFQFPAGDPAYTAVNAWFHR